MKPALPLIALLGAMSVGACSPSADEQARDAAASVRAAASRAGDRLADGWVTARVQARYFADDDIKARYIDVTTRDSVVTLKGYVENDDVRRHAVQLAQTTEGVSRVDDRLMIGQSPQQASAETGSADAVGTGGMAAATYGPIGIWFFAILIGELPAARFGIVRSDSGISPIGALDSRATIGADGADAATATGALICGCVGSCAMVATARDVPRATRGVRIVGVGTVRRRVAAIAVTIAACARWISPSGFAHQSSDQIRCRRQPSCVSTWARRRSRSRAIGALA